MVSKLSSEYLDWRTVCITFLGIVVTVAVGAAGFVANSQINTQEKIQAQIEKNTDKLLTVDSRVTAIESNRGVNAAQLQQLLRQIDSTIADLNTSFTRLEAKIDNLEALKSE